MLGIVSLLAKLRRRSHFDVQTTLDGLKIRAAESTTEPLPTFDVAQMADDYPALPVPEFEAKYPGWWPRYESALRDEFARRREARP